MAMAKETVAFLCVMALCGVSLGAVHKVGDSAGWTTIGNVDYSKWAAGKNFHVGDSIVFEYNNKFHNVKQVTPQDFLSCNASFPVSTYTSGSDSINLRRPGHYYYLCGFPGHCQAGQKVDILVTVASVSPSASPIPAPSASSPSASSPVAISPVTAENSASSLCLSGFLVALSGLAIFLTGFLY